MFHSSSGRSEADKYAQEYEEIGLDMDREVNELIRKAGEEE